LYSAKVIMVPAQTGKGGIAGRLGGNLGALVGLANIDLDSGTSKEQAIAILKSRRLTEQFIKDENLLPALYPDLWDGDKGQWKDPEEVPTLGAAFRKFDRSVRFVQEDAETGLIALEIIWSDREKAAQWANALVARVNQRTRELAQEEAERSLRYLNEQLTRTDLIELRQAMYGLIEQHVKNIMLAKVRDEYAFKVIDPAVVPEPGTYVSPRSTLLIGIALVFGVLLGIAWAFLRYLIARSRELS